MKRHKTKARRFSALALILSLAAVAALIFSTSSAGAIAAGDISVDFLAAGPGTYDHTTGDPTVSTFGFNSRNISKTDGVVESLEGGDFECGDKVIFFEGISVNAGAKNTDTGTLTLSTAFNQFTTSGGAVGFTSVDSVVLLDGDGAWIDNGGNAVLTDWTQSTTPSQVIANITLAGLDPGDFIVVQYTVILDCREDPAGVTGNIQTSVDSGQVDGRNISVGRQTVPLKGAGDIQVPGLSLTKTPSVTEVCNGIGTEVTYTYVVTNDGNVALTGNVVDDSGTSLDTSDDVTVGTFTDLAPGASATLTHTATISATTTNIATATASSSTQSVSETATATVTGIDCSLSLTKDADADQVCIGPDSEVTYTYVLTNTGDVAVSGTVRDDNGTPADETDDFDVGTFTELAPDASQTFTATRTLSGSRTNIATATATALGQTVTASATETVNGVNCAISLTKSADADQVCNGLDTLVTYTYVVTNDGDVPVSGSVSDDLLGAIGSFTDLAPGASATFTASATISGATTNVGTATASALGHTITASATETVNGVNCSVNLTKTPDVAEICVGANTPVNYAYVVTNTGDVPLSGSVSDNLLGAIGSFTDLAPGASVPLSASATISETTTNVATVTATALTHTVTDQASATVTAYDCTISLSKVPDLTQVCDGTTVGYTYVVTNNSTAFSWTGSISDNVLGAIAGPITLAPGESRTFTASGPITGTVINTGTASGAFNDPALASASAEATATVTGYNCTISLTKVPDVTEVCDGTTVGYTYTITNNSPAFSWTGSLVDNVLGTIANPITLGPGASQSFTASGAVTGTVTNIGTASGLFNDAASVTASAEATATVNGYACGITLTKVPDVAAVCAGGVVTYTYTITNGAFTWTGSLVDDQLGTIANPITLGPGQTATFAATATLAVTTTNIATATGSLNDTAITPASATADATVVVQACGGQPSAEVTGPFDLALSADRLTVSGNFVVADAGDSDGVSVIQQWLEIQYKDGRSFVAIGASCNFSPSVAYFVPDGQPVTVQFTCTVDQAIPNNAKELRVTAFVNIAERSSKTFSNTSTVRLSRS